MANTRTIPGPTAILPVGPEKGLDAGSAVPGRITMSLVLPIIGNNYSIPKTTMTIITRNDDTPWVEPDFFIMLLCWIEGTTVIVGWLTATGSGKPCCS